MLSHHFLIHSLLGIPASAPCHCCGLVTAWETNSISNEDISGLWECIHVQMVSKHLLNEPNFALDPKYHLYTHEGKHAHTYTEADILRTSCEKYPNASWLHFFCFAFCVCVCVCVFSLSNLEWFLEIENQHYQSSIQNSQPSAKAATDTGAQKR